MRVNGKKVGDKPDPGPAFGLSSGLANRKVTVFVGIRAQQKEKTRRTLIDAAFSQLCANRSFSNLSLMLMWVVLSIFAGRSNRRI